MANTIQLRRSAIANAVPTTTQLALGELAINTFDGKLYLKKNVSGTETVVVVGTVTSIGASGGTTGLTFSGSPITTSGTLTLGGTLAVTNGGTGVTISTGTGSNVLSDSPTITGTIGLSGAAISAPAWTTTGIGIKQLATTYTDTTSTGTVADIRINTFAGPTLAASTATTATVLYGTYFSNPVAGTNVTATQVFALGADSLRVTSNQTVNGNIAVGGSINFNSPTAVMTIGAATSTGIITLGQSTVSQTTNIQAGITASGSTKTISLGTNGASGSTTNITIGSATSGATSNITVNGFLINPTLRAYSEDKVTNATTTGIVTLDLSTSNVFHNTLTGNTTFAFSNPPANTKVFSFTIITVQDATGGRTITWPTSKKFSGGSTPPPTTAANAVDVWSVMTYDGGTSYIVSLSVKDAK